MAANFGDYPALDLPVGKRLPRKRQAGFLTWGAIALLIGISSIAAISKIIWAGFPVPIEITKNAMPGFAKSLVSEATLNSESFSSGNKIGIDPFFRDFFSIRESASAESGGWINNLRSALTLSFKAIFHRRFDIPFKFSSPLHFVSGRKCCYGRSKILCGFTAAIENIKCNRNIFPGFNRAVYLDPARANPCALGGDKGSLRNLCRFGRSASLYFGGIYGFNRGSGDLLSERQRSLRISSLLGRSFFRLDDQIMGFIPKAISIDRQTDRPYSDHKIDKSVPSNKLPYGIRLFIAALGFTIFVISFFVIAHRRNANKYMQPLDFLAVGFFVGSIFLFFYVM